MSFFVKDDDVLDKYNEIWDVIKNKLSIKFHNFSVYDQKYWKAKVKEFGGVIKTNFLGNGLPKESTHYTCIACITIDSVMRMEKLSTSLFRRVQYKIKKLQMPRFINTELDSESDSDSDAELMAKLKSDSDNDSE